MPYHTIPYHAVPYHTMPCHTHHLGAYRLTLTARLATGSSAYASVALLVNAPPYGGTLILTLTPTLAQPQP